MWKASLALVCLAGTASADSLSTPARPDAPSVAITTSPVHLLIPMAEIAAEIRVADKIGVAVIGGVGMVRDRLTNAKIGLYEGGASLRYYVTGSFRTGLQLGAETIYIHASTTSQDVDINGAGLAVSPFAGYKWTHGSGLTLEGQLGASFMVVRAKAETGEMSERSDVGPMVNLQVGYSF